MKTWRRHSLLLGTASALIALGMSACSANNDETTSALAESEVGTTAPPDEGSDTADDAPTSSRQTADGQAGDDGATSASQAPSEGITSGGDPAAAGGRDQKSRVALTMDDLRTVETEPIGPVEIQPAAFGTLNEGTIEQTFDIDRWTFNADAGSMLGIEVLSIGDGSDCYQDLYLNLLLPSGIREEVAWVGNGYCQVLGPLLLEEAGEYSIEFLGGDGGRGIESTTGAYQFVPLILTEVDITPLAFDRPNEGHISEVLGVDRWTFNAAAGDVISFDMASIGDGSDCYQDLSFVLDDPTGQRISDTELWVGNGYCQAVGPYEFTADGEYVLEFYGGNGGSGIESTTGPYQFTASWL